MNEHDDYLWDGRGPADPELARLERLLAPLALPPATLPRVVPRRRRWQRVALAMAASLALSAGGIGLWLQHRLAWPDGGAWPVLAVAGAVQLNGEALGEAVAIAPGDGLTTGPDGWARVQVAGIGELRLAENSHLRMETTRRGEHRVRLHHGRLWARVWAPPQQFGVNLPGARLFDLGCEFVVETDASGHGRLSVLSGWVLVDRAGGEALVPEGAQIVLREGQGIGTPHAVDAAPAFVETLRAIDVAGVAPDAHGDAVQRLASLARPQDAITLLTLLQRHPQLAAGSLFDRLVQVLPGQPALQRAGVLGGEPAALQQAWDALPYPRAKRWWWHWRDALPRQAEVPER